MDILLVLLVKWLFLLCFLGVTKEAAIVTPLMDFVRQKRAAKSGTRVGFLLDARYVWTSFIFLKCLLRGMLFNDRCFFFF